MKSNRRLGLRREVMTSLDPDVLRTVAAGQPDTVNRQCIEQFSDCIEIDESLRCPLSRGPVHCGPTVDVNGCPTLIC